MQSNVAESSQLGSGFEGYRIEYSIYRAQYVIQFNPVLFNIQSDEIQ